MSSSNSKTGIYEKLLNLTRIDSLKLLGNTNRHALFLNCYFYCSALSDVKEGQQLNPDVFTSPNILKGKTKLRVKGLISVVDLAR